MMHHEKDIISYIVEIIILLLSLEELFIKLLASNLSTHIKYKSVYNHWYMCHTFTIFTFTNITVNR